MLGESKFDILEKIRPHYKPATILVKAPATSDTLKPLLKAAGISFPLIAKPDKGERGWLVEKISDWDALSRYFSPVQGDFIIQGYVDFPLEAGVFYYRFPGEASGHISSVVLKDFLKIRGDGRSTVLKLMNLYPRARFQVHVLREKYPDLMKQIPAAGSVVELVPIGNHCKGTTFLNGNHLINEQLVAVFDEISRSIEGFYYGRFDLRCPTIEDLYAGRHIRVMELNGAGAEPGHIYQPGFSIIEAYRVIFAHWQVLYRISRQNHTSGVPYMTWKGVRETMSQYKQYKKINSQRAETAALGPLHSQLT
jgi:hypothetical protein